MTKIDFSALALSPNESRAARNYFGLSQAQAAAKSNLPAHKLKRFESGNYVPDAQFLEDLRQFFEGEGYNFHDEDAPGAKAKARGDVFQAGVVGDTVSSTGDTVSSTGDTVSSTGETDGSPSVEPGKLPRPHKANLQYMRISPAMESEQIDRVFDCIEENETALCEGCEKQINTGFLSGGPSELSQAQAIALLRRLAENGLLYARLMGRDLIPVADGSEEAQVSPAKPRPSLFSLDTNVRVTGSWKTIGELLQVAMNDVQLAVVAGDKEAQARRKGRAEPTEVLQALVG